MALQNFPWGVAWEVCIGLHRTCWTKIAATLYCHYQTLSFPLDVEREKSKSSESLLQPNFY